MVALAMALGALILGVPPLPEHATPSLAPLVARLLAQSQTTERPAQQQQQQAQQAQQEQAQQADGDVDGGKHPLKKMQKRVLAHEKKAKLEKAQDKMRKVEKARENAGKQGEGDHKKKLKKKIKAMEKMKNARARKDQAAKTHDAEQEETREYTHTLDTTASPAADSVLNTASWCPTRGGQSIDALLDGAGLKWVTPYNHSTPQRCDLSAKQWLFVVSPGGRTGSTTVLDMVNAHPAFGLAGENGGQLLTAMEMYKTAAQQGIPGDAWGRGNVDPYNLLCDLAGWFEDVTPPKEKGELTMESLQAHAEAAEKAKAVEEVSRSATPSGSSVSEQGNTVQGFKEIRWGNEDATALWFLKALFPCHRLVFSERPGDWQSKFSDGDKEARIIEHWRSYAKQQPEWHNWWIKLEADGFDKKSFDGMLEWFGEPKDGCHFQRVETANHGEGGYKNGEGNLLDASKCQLKLG